MSICRFSWLDRMRLVQDIISRSPREVIGLPHDGDMFVDDTAAECVDRLEALRDIGYRVPQDAIDALREWDVT